MFSNVNRLQGNNEDCIGECTLLIQNSIIDGQDGCLVEVNKAKKGAPFRYAESIIEALYYLRLKYELPYRELERTVYEISKYFNGFKGPDYTTIHKRVKKMSENKTISHIIKDDKTTIIIDEDGVRIFSSNDLRLQFWKVSKMYQKVLLKINRNRQIDLIDLE
uniref:Transposase DDE domain-containing protein n=1 Tax=Candidatus Methanomethylicus mesodigestus TaxID=1867258 RepID=A0A7C3ERX5_9CREN